MRTIKFRVWDKQFSKMIDICLPKKYHTDWERYELMQYTGLKDKNGVEIYEGDICNQLLLRKFGEEENPRYVGEVTFQPSSGYRVGSEGIWPNDCEIIGNIYENPELIEKGK